jgi:hypothetical protein
LVILIAQKIRVHIAKRPPADDLDGLARAFGNRAGGTVLMDQGR